MRLFIFQDPVVLLNLSVTLFSISIFNYVATLDWRYLYCHMAYLVDKLHDGRIFVGTLWYIRDYCGL